MAADCCVFKSLRRSVIGKYVLSFQNETSVFTFLRLVVDMVLQYCILLNNTSESYPLPGQMAWVLWSVFEQRRPARDSSVNKKTQTSFNMWWHFYNWIFFHPLYIVCSILLRSHIFLPVVPLVRALWMFMLMGHLWSIVQWSSLLFQR